MCFHFPFQPDLEHRGDEEMKTEICKLKDELQQQVISIKIASSTSVFSFLAFLKVVIFHQIINADGKVHIVKYPLEILESS